MNTAIHPLVRRSVEFVIDQEKARGTFAFMEGDSRYDDPTERDVVHQRYAQPAVRRAIAFLNETPTAYRGAMLDLLHDADQHPGQIDQWVNDRTKVNLWIVGPSGRGKTFAAYAALAEHVVRQVNVVAWSFPALLDAVRRDPNDDARNWDIACEAPVLLLDDLYSAKVSEWSRERLYILSEKRTSQRLRTILTTNAPREELFTAWGTTPILRLTSSGACVKFTGACRRGGGVTW